VVLDSGSHAGGDASFEAPALDRPTDACVSGVALLNAMGAQAAAHLHGSNLAAFLGELARRTAAVIETHALRYTFSSEGALRWRRDVAEFATCLAGLEARGAPLFEDLHSLASLLIVGPDSLPGLVDGLVHIDRQRVQRIVERREDYKTAKIGDRPLTLPFA